MGPSVVTLDGIGSPTPSGNGAPAGGARYRMTTESMAASPHGSLRSVATSLAASTVAQVASPQRSEAST